MCSLNLKYANTQHILWMLELHDYKIILLDVVSGIAQHYFQCFPDDISLNNIGCRFQ